MDALFLSGFTDFHQPGVVEYPKTLPTDKTVVVYCYTGQNSARIATYLRLMGYNAKSITFGCNGMIYDEMTKSKWSEGAIMGYDYVTSN